MICFGTIDLEKRTIERLFFESMKNAGQEEGRWYR